MHTHHLFLGLVAFLLGASACESPPKNRRPSSAATEPVTEPPATAPSTSRTPTPAAPPWGEPVKVDVSDSKEEEEVPEALRKLREEASQLRCPPRPKEKEVALAERLIDLPEDSRARIVTIEQGLPNESSYFSALGDFATYEAWATGHTREGELARIDVHSEYSVYFGRTTYYLEDGVPFFAFRFVHFDSSREAIGKIDLEALNEEQLQGYIATAQARSVRLTYYEFDSRGRIERVRSTGTRNTGLCPKWGDNGLFIDVSGELEDVPLAEVANLGGYAPEYTPAQIKTHFEAIRELLTSGENCEARCAPGAEVDGMCSEYVCPEPGE